LRSPGRSFEKQYAETIFKLANPLAERWLGDVERSGGAPEAAVFCGGNNMT
jgi:hypothetical protein